MPELIDKHEYSDVHHGGRVVIKKEREPNSSAVRLRVFEYNEDDSRMAYAKFSANKDSCQSRFQTGTHDKPSDTMIAAMHDYGYEIQNISDTILDLTTPLVDPIMASRDAAVYFEEISDASTSEYITMQAEALAVLTNILSTNLWVAMKDDAPFDQAILEMNQEMRGGSESLREVLVGNFKTAAMGESKTDARQDILEQIDEERRELERNVFLVNDDD